MMLFTRFLSWLLRRFQAEVIAVMCGFLVGSLSIIWPWKNTLSVGITDAGKGVVTVAENLFPGQFLAVTGQDPQTLLCLFVFFIGFVMVLSVDFLNNRKL